MAAVPPEQRAAYYVSTAVLADPAGKVVASATSLHGSEIVLAEIETAQPQR